MLSTPQLSGGERKPTAWSGKRGSRTTPTEREPCTHEKAKEGEKLSLSAEKESLMDKFLFFSQSYKNRKLGHSSLINNLRKLIFLNSFI